MSSTLASFCRVATGLALSITAAACGSWGTPTGTGPAPGTATVAPAQAADTIYTGGDIVTVNDAQPTAEAVALKDGRILAVGTRAEVERTSKGPATRVVDLAGRALVPGFVDGHAHVGGFGGQAVGANLLAPLNASGA